MIMLLFRDCTTNKVKFGVFNVVDNNFCDWNRQAFYLATIKKKHTVYNVYSYFGKIIVTK